MSDLDYLDRYPATVDCAENTIRSGTPAPTVLHPLELLRVGEHAGVLASVKALDQFRYQQKGFAIEALQLLRRSARQLYRIAQSNRQTEIGLDLAPGNTRAIVFFDSLRKVPSVKFVLKAFERPLAHLRGKRGTVHLGKRCNPFLLIRLERSVTN